jgi:hypothetical protein
MKVLAQIFILLTVGFNPLFSQQYASYFNDNSCRVDFHFCGNATTTAVYLDKVMSEPYWGGRRNNLGVYLNLGDYRFRVLDSITDTQLYVDGFNSFYREWQTTPESKIVSKSFEQSILFPYPKYPVILIIEKRLDFDTWSELFRYSLKPDDKLICRTQPKKVPVKVMAKTAAPAQAIDIAVIAEGYTASEKSKFYRDVKQLKANILSHQPFVKYKNRMNIYAIAAPSEKSGISIPQDSVWKNTAVGSHFFTFYEPRYLTTFNNFKVRDLAALVPYDAIYILVNTSTYGGGGFYNMYALSAAHNKLTQQVTVHEFGHSFTGLGDEYFKENADVLDAMYNINVEPWEPNITSLKKFDKKWEKSLSTGTIIPTPVTDETKQKLGVFEGGGYLTKGMYRSMYDCRMRTNAAPGFCPVCQKAVEKTMLFLTE